MSKNYEDYKPINPMPPRKRRNPALTFVQFAIIILLMLALVLSAVYFVSSHLNEKDGAPNDTTPPLATGDLIEPSQTDEVTTGEEPIQSEPAIDLSAYQNIDFSKTQINKGDLILVDSGHPIVYPTNDELIDFYGNKTASYQISSATMKIQKHLIGIINGMMDDFAASTGKNDVIVWTAYRDEARQTVVYNDYVAAHGEEAAKTAVAKPGESDHHTALGIALRVFDAAGLSHQISEVEGYSWIEENCYKYGFVERYPDDKISITGLNYSTSVYLRYVGVPHAEIMKKNNLCLEEYLTFLKGYVFGTTHYEYTTEDGISYEVYYVDGTSEGDTVSIPVPAFKEYTVSGNNIDGFIVTAKK